MTADPFRGLPGPSYLSYPLGSNPSFVDLLRASSNGPDPRADSAGQNASRDIPAASDIYGEMGAVVHEAFFRQRSAEQLVAEGRRAEADEQLRPTLAFYRSVGATRYVREGEALMAATA